MRGRLVAGVVALCSLTHCTGRPAHEEKASVSSRTIEDVLATHTDSLMSLPGVVGTAIGVCDGAACIRVLVSDSTAASRRQIPNRLEGYLVRVEVSGILRPLPGDERNRPP